MWQPSQLVSTPPVIRVAATAARGLQAAQLRSREAITVRTAALVQARFMHALVDVPTALIMGSHAELCCGPGWPSGLHSRRVCFVRSAWARIRAEAHASSSILDHASLVRMFHTHAVRSCEDL